MGEESNSACESNSTYESTSIHGSTSMGDGKLKGACNYCPKHIDLQNDKVTTECTLSHGMPCPPCARQMKLRAEIEETKKILDKLIAEEHQARMDMNHYHDPLNRFPPEIISHIFRFTIPEFQLQEENKRPRSEPGALVLGAVCHMWREIAWSTPQLWSTVMLSRIHYPPTDNMNDVVKEWLKRSQKLPLSIRLYLASESVSLLDDRGHEEESPHARWFIDLFLDHSSRWQDLSVQCPHGCLFSHFGQPSYSDRDGPHALKTLQLIFSSAPKGAAEFLPCGATPQPERVILSGFSQFRYLDLSWKNATDVTINGLYITDFIQLLQDVPKLVHLTVHNMHNGYMHVNPVPNPPLALYHLQTFCVSTDLSIKFILDSIELPSLEKLSILGIDADIVLRNPSVRGPFSSIIQFLERSSCPLTSFILQGGACRDEDVLSLLNALPSTVKTLELDLRSSQPARRMDLNLPVVFGHLSRFSTATDETLRAARLLPDLESFTYFIFDYTRFRIPWHLLPSIARPVFGEKRPLKNLEICSRESSRSGLPMLTRDTAIGEDDIHGLISLVEDGVELSLGTTLVTRESLLELLERCDISQLETL